jgi:hypothetical protein
VASLADDFHQAVSIRDDSTDEAQSVTTFSSMVFRGKARLTLPLERGTT